MLTSRNELIAGELAMDRVPGAHNDDDGDDGDDDKVHFAWDWVNPATQVSEVMRWDQSDDGVGTRYGCRVDRPWSAGGGGGGMGCGQQVRLGFAICCVLCEGVADCCRIWS
ncbi:hypothetical protein PMIN06_012735 [Paraphaeosphaeria minitans]